jgi:ABC-2 type transport system permease protein
MLSINALNGMKAGLGMSYLTQISNDYVRSALPPQAMTAMKQIPQIELKPYYRYNPKLKYYPFMVPGIFVILLTVMTGILSSQNIVREKEVGTIEQLNVTPISKTVFILGKIIPFWIIGFVVLTIGMIVAWLMYDVYPMGSILTIYAFAAIYIVAFTGLGIVISNYANTQQQAMLLTFFFLMICIMFSGLFAPVSSMPDWMQRVAMCNPLRYFVEVIRMVYLKGAGIGDIVPQMLKECCFVLLFNIWAVLSYKKTS